MTTPFGPLGQLGYAVHDLDPWVDTLLATGVGPWWITRRLRPDRFVFEGEATDAEFAVAISWSRGVMFEIIEPLDDQPSPYRDYLRSGRQGVQHLAFFPKAPEQACAELERAGRALCVEGNSGGFGFKYFADPKGGDTIEIGVRSPDVLARHAALEAVCDGWDGSLPRRESARPRRS